MELHGAVSVRELLSSSRLMRIAAELVEERRRALEEARWQEEARARLSRYLGG